MKHRDTTASEHKGLQLFEVKGPKTCVGKDINEVQIQNDITYQTLGPTYTLHSQLVLRNVKQVTLLTPQ